MLKLVDVVKNYSTGDDEVMALKGVSLEFRQAEFVSILGPSGCGKTTMLNIVGGLDRYTSGDLIISGKSTKQFKDKDWDVYRNTKVGFVFQNYQLISHLSIYKNVEMALSLSGVKPSERKAKVEKALADVGLSDKLNKKPNQLSGGQMQRVSIARALVNNPEIILADEPTGALDSNTSVQIMEMLAEIAKEKLVIMVTHNGDLAKQYSTRIISLLDGEVIHDTNPIVHDDVESEEKTEEEKSVENEVAQDKKALLKKKLEERKERRKKIWRNLGKKQKEKEPRTSMSFFTALTLSFRNLLTKKVRTILTAVAGSIGIIGVGLVLAISNGFSAYIEDLEEGALSGFPIMVSEVTYDSSKVTELSNYVISVDSDETMEAFPTDGKIYTKESTKTGNMDSMEDYIDMFKDMVVTNNLDNNYYEYLSKLSEKDGTVHYQYDIDLHLVTKNKLGEYNEVNNGKVGLQQLLGNRSFVESQYTIIAGVYPQNANETVIIVDKYNRIEKNVLELLGIDSTRDDITIDELMVNDFARFAENNHYYSYDESKGYYTVNKEEDIYNKSVEHQLKIVGVLRINEGVDYQMMSTGIAYTEDLVKLAFSTGKTSDVVKAQSQLLEQYKADCADAIARTGFATNVRLKNVITGKYYEVDLISGTISNIIGIDNNYETECEKTLISLGGIQKPSLVYIFPKGFQGKDNIKSYLDEYNDGKSKENQVVYTDVAETATDMANQFVKIITIVLICFASISLVVSSVMIGIITYVSVVERTREIGILRSIGARKIDISNVFNAETTIIGFTSGVIGVAITYLLSIPVNIIIKHYANLTANIAALEPLYALLLVVLSVFLTFIAGLIPAFMAAKKDPVIALRSE